MPPTRTTTKNKQTNPKPPQDKTNKPIKRKEKKIKEIRKKKGGGKKSPKR